MSPIERAFKMKLPPRISWQWIIVRHFMLSLALILLAPRCLADGAGRVTDAVVLDGNGMPKPLGHGSALIAEGDRIVVTVQDLDGYLYAEMQTGRIPADEWLDDKTILLTSTTSIGDLYIKDKDGTDPAVALRSSARSGVNTMVREIQQILYLQLGPARLRSLRPQDPFVSQNQKGQFQFEFLVHSDASDADEWKKLRNVRSDTRPISVTLGFDLKDVSRSLPTDLNAPNLLKDNKGGRRFSFVVFSPKFSDTAIVFYFVALFGDARFYPPAKFHSRSRWSPAEGRVCLQLGPGSTCVVVFFDLGLLGFSLHDH